MNPEVSPLVSSEQGTNPLTDCQAPQSKGISALNRQLTLLASILLCSCSLPGQRDSTVIVVDHFKIPEVNQASDPLAPNTSHLIDVDQDSAHDISHGALVSQVIKTLGARSKHLDGGVDSIKNIPHDAKVVNISLSINFSFESLSQRIGLRVTPDNVKSLRAEVLDRLERLPNNEPDSPDSIANIVKNIRHLESLARSGVTIVIAAGNLGRENLNMLTLAEGCVVVGGLDANGKKHQDSGNNSLVTEWRPFSIQPKIIPGGMSLYGNQVDLKWSRTSSRGEYRELKQVPHEVIAKATEACESATLKKLAMEYKKFGLVSGMYRPSNLFFDAKKSEDGASVISSRFSDQNCLIAFKNSETPQIWIITGEKLAKVPAHAIKFVEAEVLVELDRHTTKATLSEKELTPILLQAGLQVGNYDLLAIQDALENNPNNHYVRIKLSRNALLFQGNSYRFANIRGENPDPIEGTSFATPVVAAELAKKD